MSSTSSSSPLLSQMCFCLRRNSPAPLLPAPAHWRHRSLPYMTLSPPVPLLPAPSLPRLEGERRERGAGNSRSRRSPDAWLCSPYWVTADLPPRLPCLVAPHWTRALTSSDDSFRASLPVRYGRLASGGCDGFVNVWDGTKKKTLYQETESSASWEI